METDAVRSPNNKGKFKTCHLAAKIKTKSHPRSSWTQIDPLDTHFSA